MKSEGEILEKLKEYFKTDHQMDDWSFLRYGNVLLAKEQELIDILGLSEDEAMTLYRKVNNLDIVTGEKKI